MNAKFDKLSKLWTKLLNLIKLKELFHGLSLFKNVVKVKTN